MDMTPSTANPDWRQELELLASQDVHAEGFDALFENFCAQHGITYEKALTDLSEVGHLETAHQIVDVLLQSRPDSLPTKVGVFNFYCSICDWLNENGVRVAEDLVQLMPHDGGAYSYLAYSYKYAGERGKLISLLKDGNKKCPNPIFFQANASQELPDPILDAVRNEISHDDVFLSEIHVDTLEHFISIKTHLAQEIGTDKAVLSGILAHTSTGGEYCFRFGAAANSMDRKTEWRAVPPGHFCEVRDTTLGTFSSWLCYGAAHEFLVDPCAITTLWPFAIDRNHLDGVGQITLLYGWRPSSLPPSDTPLTQSRIHSIDLRGGKVAFQVRHKNMDSKGGSFVFSIGSFLVGGRRSSDGHKTWAASQWMMTGKPTPCANTHDKEWDEISFDIEADPQLWSYGSNNSTQADSERYGYAPLSQMVACHNGNLVICQMFADEKALPEGEITLREGRVIYRDWSMLRNGYGAELVSFPGNDRDAALKLTNGQYRGLSDGWNSVNDEASPPHKFVWKLPEDGQPDGIVLVQHPRYPVLMAQVYLRNGGPNGRVVYAGLANLPAPGFDTPKRVYITVPDTISATHLEVSLMQGQNADGIGLMGVEVFGKFTPILTAAEPVTVCEDIKGLKPGSDLHYRLVYRDETGVTESEVHTLKIPSDATPILHTLCRLEDEDNAWLVHGNPMGLETLLEVRLDQEMISELPFGRGTYRRHIIARIPQELYAPGKILSVQAKNHHGASEIVSLTLP